MKAKCTLPIPVSKIYSLWSLVQKNNNKVKVFVDRMLLRISSKLGRINLFFPSNIEWLFD